MHKLRPHHLLQGSVAPRVADAGRAGAAAWQRIKLRLHLAVCDGCTRFERQMRFLRAAMRTYRE